MARAFDLLVLDFDGTLADSQAILVGMVNEVLLAHGLPCADEAAVARTIGLPLAEVYRRALPGADTARIDALCCEYRRRADRADFVARFRLFPGVAETLVRLQARGVRLVIGTSKARATTCDILEHCGIQAVISGVIGGDCVARGKPHPETVERARSLFDAAPERTLMVGDTSFDVDMGHAAGVATCAVSYGMQPVQALRLLRPTFVIDRIDELDGIVGLSCG